MPVFLRLNDFFVTWNRKNNKFVIAEVIIQVKKNTNACE